MTDSGSKADAITQAAANPRHPSNAALAQHNKKQHQSHPHGPSAAPEPLVDVKLHLSRPRYRAGGVVVGTVHLSWDANNSNNNNNFHPQSARLYLSGHARIDPRWLTDAESLRGLYGRHPALAAPHHLPEGVEDRAVRQVFGDCQDGVHLEGGQTVCFYATNVVDLLAAAGGGNGSGSGSAKDTDADAARPGGKKKRQRQEMAFTFRSTLPDDAPPSVSTATARYFYSAVVCIETGPYEGDDTILVQAPFAVTQCSSSGGSIATTMSSDGHNSLGARVKVGTLEVLSRGNAAGSDDDEAGDHTTTGTAIQPICYIPPTEFHQPAKLSVDRDFGLCATARGSSDVKSLRIANQDGIPCCVLTLVGATTMRPGGAAMILCDFAEDVVLRRRKSSTAEGDGVDTSSSEKDSPTSLLPCYRVSAFLHGEEYALNEDGTSRRTRSFAFDSKHVRVEPGCTDSVSLDICLPLSCPISMHTDLVKVVTACKIVLTVKKYVSTASSESSGDSSSEGASNQYDFLTLQMPCNVVHGFDEDDEEAEGKDDLAERRHVVGADSHEDRSFAVCDIMKDLKVLAMSATQ